MNRLNMANQGLKETTRLIFDDPYMVRVPILATRSELDIKLFGFVYTGNPDIDKGHVDEWVTVMWTINHMIEKYKKGFPIKIVKRDDVKKIYEAITRHLNEWKTFRENSINIIKVPYEDLLELDNFAQLIYDTVKQDVLTVEEDPSSYVDDYFKQFEFMNARDFGLVIENGNVNNNQSTRVENVGDRTQALQSMPDRFSFKEIFKK